jgi:hypothetical protein
LPPCRSSRPICGSDDIVMAIFACRLLRIECAWVCVSVREVRRD